MKFKQMLLILCLATLSVAQTSTPAKTDPGPGEKAATNAQVKAVADCPCCQKMADSPDAKSCCRHDAATTSEQKAMSCCQSKDGMSCVKGNKDKSVDAACASGKGGDKATEKCCAKNDKTEQATMACCGGATGQCGMAHHNHGDVKE
ncbi:MAG: hypothetical protein WB952_24115 [Terriglobales bacterium]